MLIFWILDSDNLNLMSLSIMMQDSEICQCSYNHDDGVLMMVMMGMVMVMMGLGHCEKNSLSFFQIMNRQWRGTESRPADSTQKKERSTGSTVTVLCSHTASA
jgi:hypothetical protein